MRTVVFVLAVGCSGSPLVESGPQVELVSNPGGVADHPRFELSLTTWNHLDALADAAASGQLEATVDGAPLVLDPGNTGSFGNGDHVTATFVLPPSAAIARAGDTTTSIVMVTDQQTTWTVEIPALFAQDMQPVGPMLANQANTAVWPSAATTDPWSTIDFACIEVAARAAACFGTTTKDPGISVAHEYVHVDVPATSGDRFTLWAERFSHPQASGGGPIFFATILDQVVGTFE